MGTHLTPTRQRNAASEGIAFGLLLCGHNSLWFEGKHMTSVSLALESAWRGWKYKVNFPQVNTDLRNGSNAEYVFTQADERKHTMCFYWDDFTVYERPYVHNMKDLSAEEVADTIDGDVPAVGWHALAKAMLDRLGVAENEE